MMRKLKCIRNSKLSIAAKPKMRCAVWFHSTKQCLNASGNKKTLVESTCCMSVQYWSWEDHANTKVARMLHALHAPPYILKYRPCILNATQKWDAVKRVLIWGSELHTRKKMCDAENQHTDILLYVWLKEICRNGHSRSISFLGAQNREKCVSRYRGVHFLEMGCIWCPLDA